MATILVVDDHEANRYLERTLLEAAGHRVLTAANGAEALSLARQTHPDLIISDVLMPVMDGFALRRACLREDALQRIPFIFYTATFSDEMDAELGRRLGAARYLVAPLENTVFLEHVHSVLQETSASPRPPFIPEEDESEFHRLYNAALVQKLEAQMHELALANRRLLAREQFVNSILDGLSTQIAIVDQDGVILTVNKAWRDFATSNRASFNCVCEGTNYLAACDAAAGAGDQDAATFAASLRAVLAGEMESAEHMYACHSPEERRWFLGRITRFPGEGPLRAIVAHENITQRVLAEQALQESERRLQKSLHRLEIAAGAAGLGVWEADLVNGVEIWDERMYTIYGVSPESFLPTPNLWRKFVHPEDLSRALAIENAAFAHNRTARTVYRIIRPDGSIRYIETHAQAELAPDGSVQKLYGVDRDITDTMEQAELQQLRETALHNAANGVVITNREGLIVWVNPAFSALTGYTSDEAIGRNPKDLIRSGLHSREFYETMWNTILSGKPWRGRLINRRKDGALYHEEQTITPVRNAEGEITHFVGIKQDITERVRDEEERLRLLEQVKAQAEQLAQIMRSAPDGILLLDAERRILNANPLAEAFLHDLVDTPSEILTRLGDCDVNELLASSRPGQWRTIHHGKRTFEATAQPVAPTAADGGWVVVIRDVTERLQVQRQLYTQERLAAVGQLAAGIAHDFNNIMSVIITYAELTAESPSLSERERERLLTIRQQALRATQMIRQILDFSRRSVIERQTFDLLTLLKEQVKLLRQTLPENIEIQLDHDQGDYLVHADPTRIQQMVMNLAVNARDAMPEGGRLRIALHHRSITKDNAPVADMKPGPWLQLTVTDTGAGIPPEILDRIFEPFFTTKAPGKGTGLGLPQVQGIVAQHEGHITVESAPGAGATFTVYLPAVVVPNNKQNFATTAVNVPRGQGETILVVEDEEFVRQALVELLGAWNYRVLAASNGAEALNWLETCADVDLVISDIVMPQLGGVRLLKELRRQGCDVPVVLMTGHAFEFDPVELRPFGLSGWLSKPPSIVELAEVIAKVLRKAPRSEVA
ncbi:MAG: response regulator [Caldilinea sp.]|nr:response regulator [Caldilinea sp.]MDW8442771.1 response regulator [Caldilineaceae bacterium]